MISTWDLKVVSEGQGGLALFFFCTFPKRLCFFSCSITSSFLRLYPQTNTKPKITFAIDVEVRVHRVHRTERQLTSLNRRRQSRSPCERLDMHYFYVRVHVSDIDTQSVGAGNPSFGLLTFEGIRIHVCW